LAAVNAILNAPPRSSNVEDAPASSDLVEVRRQLLADLCRLLGQRINGESLDRATPRESKRETSPLPELSPRMRQTLDRLLAGDSEKQIAHRMGLSRHTVHVYVKAIYRGFSVSSRGELLSKFVQAPIYKQ
jgi:DNA-binding NarL/FixJ family response regulator